MSDLHLFVYGTLADGSSHAHLLGDRRRGPAWMQGALYHLPAGYPAVVPSGEGTVHGQWVDPVPDRVLRLLDRYEGVDEGLYRREIVTIHTAGSTLKAWAWVMDDPSLHGGILVPSGRWRAVHRR